MYYTSVVRRTSNNRGLCSSRECASFFFICLFITGRCKKGANNREFRAKGNLDDICSRSVRLPNVDFHRKTSN